MDKSNDFVKVRNIFTGRTDEKRRNIWEFWRWDKDMKTKNNGWELLDGEQKDEMIDKFTQAIAMKTTEKKTANSAEIDEINDIGAPIPQEKRKKK